MAADRSPLDTVREPVGRSGLVRPRQGRWIAGVSVGLARRVGIAPWIVRLAFVGALILPPPALIVYAALWLIMPSED
jgi:phage shock protein PspC (stress-responsive transcriptional regulator)